MLLYIVMVAPVGPIRSCLDFVAESFCLSFRVCLLGVLTLIISWGSLGLELAVAAVSVTMATSQSSLPLQ